MSPQAKATDTSRQLLAGGLQAIQNAANIDRQLPGTFPEFVSATSSQGSCALASREELGILYNPTNGYGSDVVECDLGAIPSGGSATVDATVTPTMPGETTNYAADTGEGQASATVEVAEHP